MTFQPLPEVYFLSKKVVPVVLSGGSGSRFWSVSRCGFPEQFWTLLSKHRFLREAASRGISVGLQNSIIICSEVHCFVVFEILCEVCIDTARIVLEPVAQNSVPAIMAAVCLVAEVDPNAILWVMAADAAIQDQAVTAVIEGGQDASGGYLTKSETGYGYIERGTPFEAVAGAYHVARSLKKPDAVCAAEFIKDQRFSWNSGVFVA